MKEIVPANLTRRNLFNKELFDVVLMIIIEISLLFLTETNIFLITQIYVIPVLAYYAFSKHKKQVVEVIIDEDSKKIVSKLIH